MSKSVWAIVIMGLMSMLVLSIAMVFTLGQFKETPVAEWVKLAESINREFKMESASVRVNVMTMPASMQIAYVTRVDSHFDLSVQNREMEKVATFALQNYKGRELSRIDRVLITRSETHGSGCFQQTYVATFTLPNTNRKAGSERGSYFQVPDAPPKDQ